MSEKIDFEVVLKNAAGLPLVKIDREKYLRTALNKYYPEDVVDKAIKYNPAYAGIRAADIEKIAKASINHETMKVTTLSFAAGLPGGPVALGTIPADLTQYFGHILRVLQKLIYLYGWKELYTEDSYLDDETANLLTLFVGIMFGVNGAVSTVNKISVSAAQKVSKSLASKPLTKGIIYPIVKKVAQMLGIRMTKDIFAKAVSKAIPIISGFISSGLTLFTFKPMAKKLKEYLATLPNADVNFYNDSSNFDEPIDVELDEKFVQSVIIDIDSKIKTDEKELSDLETKYASAKQR